MGRWREAQEISGYHSGKNSYSSPFLDEMGAFVFFGRRMREQAFSSGDTLL